MKKSIYNSIIKKTKKLAILIDPDKVDTANISGLIQLANKGKIDFFFVGGSLVAEKPEKIIIHLKKHSKVPVILFPGSLLQFTPSADAILLLSLISGRNPELLIGNHVALAPFLKKSKMQVLPTGYILINTGSTSSVEYISNTVPIPDNKTDIVVATAIAGEMLGLKLIYLEAGSGAQRSVSSELIDEVKQNINIPLIVGGGIKTEQHIKNVCDAGADIIVLGTVAEKELGQINKFSDIIHSYYY
ncbi:MAG: geranylgeranylglyceryl/heptaprenylglyceryl phosphate synthase [Bacteroidales bacterium]|nr:geranylgeranylglyceryl/heptaprenylglyceryl phosphate synthase [Bacteroidales bacterium]